MKLYFNRTSNKIFEDEAARQIFYDTFFDEYNIDLENSHYIHLHDETAQKYYHSTTIFFVGERIIIFKAELIGMEYVPYKGYDVEIYLKSEIKALKFDCNGEDSPTYNVKIDMGKEVIEFSAEESYRQDCKKAIKFLNALLDAKGNE